MDVKVGQMVSAGMQSIRVVNLSNLKVKAEIAEAYISKVKQGNDVVVLFPDLNKDIIENFLGSKFKSFYNRAYKIFYCGDVNFLHPDNEK